MILEFGIVDSNSSKKIQTQRNLDTVSDFLFRFIIRRTLYIHVLSLKIGLSSDSTPNNRFTLRKIQYEHFFFFWIKKCILSKPFQESNYSFQICIHDSVCFVRKLKNPAPAAADIGWPGTLSPQSSSYILLCTIPLFTESW